MRFGLVANLKRHGAEDAIAEFIRWSERPGQELLFCEELRAVCPTGFKCLPRDQLSSRVDIVVSMGGDGTLLATARACGRSGTPLLGINLGSLGFLTQLTPMQLIPALDAIVIGKYEIEERMLLEVKLAGTNRLASPYALNDVVVDNGSVSRMIDIDLKVNGEEIVTYKADGLILSTPTGSTAYNLAVGGPIMQPKLKAVIVAPISAFSLTTRPMIFSENDLLEVRIRSDGGKPGLTLDGQVTTLLEEGEWVSISKADFAARFILMPGNSFYRILKNKLHWGIHPAAEE